MGGMAARCRSGYSVPCGVERSLTLKPSDFCADPKTALNFLIAALRKFDATPKVVCVEYLLNGSDGVSRDRWDFGH